MATELRHCLKCRQSRRADGFVGKWCKSCHEGAEAARHNPERLAEHKKAMERANQSKTS